MPLYDFVCQACGKEYEAMAGVDDLQGCCPSCGGEAKRLVSVGLGFRSDASWLGTVPAVVDKDSDKPHVRAFLADQNRRTYREWMHGEGLRPLEAGEGQRPGPDLGPVRRQVMERCKARRGLA